MQRKSLVATVKATTEGAGEWEAIASTPELDRDGEIIAAGAFNPLPASVPVHEGHNFDRVIGRGVPFYDGDVLKIRGTFASTPKAQEVRTLVKEGILTSMSVAFTKAAGKVIDGVRHITSGELLAVDFVSVPSLRQAEVLAARSAGYNADDTAAVEALHLYLQTELTLLSHDVARLQKDTAKPIPAHLRPYLRKEFADHPDVQLLAAEYAHAADQERKRAARVNELMNVSDDTVTVGPGVHLRVTTTPTPERSGGMTIEADPPQPDNAWMPQYGPRR